MNVTYSLISGSLSVEGNVVLRWETLVLMKNSCAVYTC